MQTDRRLVQHVARADQAAADLRRQTDALRFAATECHRLAAEREVVQTDGSEEAESTAHLAHDRLGDLLARRREVEVLDDIERGRHPETREGGDVEIPRIRRETVLRAVLLHLLRQVLLRADRHRQRLDAKAIPEAAGARELGLVLV